MTGLLLDTNVLSEMRKPPGRINPAVRDWAAGVDSANAFVSAITISELSQWVASTHRRDVTQGDLLDRWLRGNVLTCYAGRVLPVDVDVAMTAGRLHVPDPRDYRDAFIAATAICHDLTVVTRNIRDFAPMHVRLFDPFSETSLDQV